jgi:hypothetical protein
MNPKKPQKAVGIIWKRDPWHRERREKAGTFAGAEDLSIDELPPPGLEGVVLTKEKPVPDIMVEIQGADRRKRRQKRHEEIMRSGTPEAD